jgi:hypothetical protein
MFRLTKCLVMIVVLGFCLTAHTRASALGDPEAPVPVIMGGNTIATTSTCTGGTCSTGVCCDVGGLCQDDPTPGGCGTRFCGTFNDTCFNTIACGACTDPAKVCTGVSCCFPGQEEVHTGGGPVCCTPTKTCASQGATCGSASDGCLSIFCGSCGTGQSCLNNQCCNLTTCAAQGKTCGSISDACGGTLNCGSCAVGQQCSAANQCVPCATTCASQGLTCGTINACGQQLTCGPPCPVPAAPPPFAAMVVLALGGIGTMLLRKRGLG